jgi:outer membrane protein TolC
VLFSLFRHDFATFIYATNLRNRTLAATVSVLLLAACTTFSPDGGLDRVSSIAQERTGQPIKQARSASDTAAIQASVAHLLAQPLTADGAVQIALMHNKGLQAALAGLGIAESDLVQAGRLRNPGISFSRLHAGNDIEIDRSVLFDIAGLLTLPLRSNIERRHFEQATLQVASDAISLAADTRRAYFSAVATQQSTQFMEQVKISAEAGAELAQRMAKLGNFTKLDYARQQVFYADATAQLARSRHRAAAARERLIRLLGLWGTDTVFTLPDRMPELPQAPKEISNSESQAMQRRLDVQMAKRDTEAAADALGLSKISGFVNVLDGAYINKSESGKPRANGYSISLEIPLFDWGSAKSGKAESQYMAAVHRTADIAIRARSEVRETYSAYRTAYDLARHYRDEVVPLRKKISDEMALRYNGMLSSVFELLAEAREQAASVNAAIETQRDFWLADTDLQMAIHGGSMVIDMRTKAEQ